MSATYDILKEVKGLVEKIKQKDEKSKNNYSANKALINNLLQMENAYKQRTAEKMPDYSELLPQEPIIKIKDDKELATEASQYVSGLVSDNLKKVNESTSNKLEKINNTQISATEKQKEKLQKASNVFHGNKETIKDLSIKQGLMHSSIESSWQDSNTREYISEIDKIRNDYDKQIANLDTQMKLINSAKQQSLYEYNLKVASEYEKKLAKLKEEQLKAVEKLGQLEDQQAKKQNEIMQLEKQWQNEQKTKDDAEFYKELQEGYTGEKAIEMENRYNKAMAFYKAMDRKTATKLIEENREELKNTLGLYYTRLIKELNN